MRYFLWCTFSLICWLSVVVQHASAQQGLNNLWLGGYGEQWDPPWGGVDMEFLSGDLLISTAARTMDHKRTSANISDVNGILLFSTNGAYLANATGDTLLNGTGLNPSTYTSNYPEGLYIPQAVLILPKPASATVFYLFHSTIDHQGPAYALQLYLTVVDMTLNGGLGGAMQKNLVLIADTLVAGKITAVRHANGRDWWVFCHRRATNIFYRLLITPEGISGLEQQAIGIVRNWAGGQVCFSPQGDRFAYYWGSAGEDLEIFDFDRCTGLLSNPVHILIDDANNHGGVAFSPNGRYLYVTSIEDVYQYDTEAPDISASMVHIAEWDSTYSPFPPLATLFDIAQLAPDGKIYIGTGNSTDRLHVIHSPDSAGLACNIEQHGIALPRYFINSLPNHPNYHLGPVDGSVCDSLGINVGIPTLSLGEGLGVRAYPNPSNGQFTLGYPAQPTAGVLEVRDLQGRLVYRAYLPPWSQLHRVELPGAAADLSAAQAGMYHCTLRWGVHSANTRIIIEP